MQTLNKAPEFPRVTAGLLNEKNSLSKEYARILRASYLAPRDNELAACLEIMARIKEINGALAKLNNLD